MAVGRSDVGAAERARRFRQSTTAGARGLPEWLKVLKECE